MSASYLIILLPLNYISRLGYKQAVLIDYPNTRSYNYDVEVFMMENNVPREKWLYPDRCMKKWLGWILSDHSAYMEEASISERPVEPKPEQSQETISDILEDAGQNAKIVAVQIGTPYDDRLLPDIEGAVIGHWDDQVYLQLKNGDTQSINAADIRNVALLNPDRWWALA